MPNNYEKERRAQEARENARAKQKAEEQKKKEANDAAMRGIDFKKLKYDAIPFKNVEIDRMNAQKKNFE